MFYGYWCGPSKTRNISGHVCSRGINVIMYVLEVLMWPLFLRFPPFDCRTFVAGFSSSSIFDYHFGILLLYCAPMLWFNTSINSQKVDNIMRCPLCLVWLIIISLWFSVNWSPLSDRTNVNKGGKLIHYSLQGVHCRYYFMQDNVFR